MIKAVEFPDKEFSTKQEMFSALIKNEKDLVNIKKAHIYEGREKKSISLKTLDASKISTVKNVGFEAKENYLYPIISTTNYFDSHKDVHFNGSMNKTSKEQQGKVMYALDHELKYNSVLAWQKDVRMFIAEIPWGLVGKSYEGNTQALVFEINKESIRNKQVLEDIENKVSEFENSIRMTYFKIRLGVNSEEKDHAEQKAYYDSRINEIANKEDVEESGYFWGVEELGIYKEGSLVVAGGSNDATSIYHKNIEPSTTDTQTTEAEKSLQTDQLEFLKTINI